LLSLIQVGEQRSVFLLKFFLFAHTVSITWGASSVTLIFLRTLRRLSVHPDSPVLARAPERFYHPVDVDVVGERRERRLRRLPRQLRYPLSSR